MAYGGAKSGLKVGVEAKVHTASLGLYRLEGPGFLCRCGEVSWPVNRSDDSSLLQEPL